jgi:hypothetical protein
MRFAVTMLAAAAATLAGCAPPQSAPGAAAGAPAELLPADREGKVALGLAHSSAAELYADLESRANGGQPLPPDDMPDWGGFWQRIGRPFFDPDQPADVLTTASLTPAAAAELERRRAQSKDGIEYDPISDCSPPGFPRWLVIPFLRELIVTPGTTYMFSETVNNMRRVYTDGRGHPPADDAYPLYYGDSIGFWAGHTLVIHTNQVRAAIFHRNDPTYSDELETVEVWRKVDPTTITADVWAYDPVTLTQPWYTLQTYKQVSNDDRSLRVDYWNCHENPNNTVIQTDQGTSQFGEFTFGK